MIGQPLLDPRAAHGALDRNRRSVAGRLDQKRVGRTNGCGSIEDFEVGFRCIGRSLEDSLDGGGRREQRPPERFALGCESNDAPAEGRQVEERAVVARKAVFLGECGRQGSGALGAEMEDDFLRLIRRDGNGLVAKGTPLELEFDVPLWLCTAATTRQRFGSAGSRSALTRVRPTSSTSSPTAM